MNPGERLHANYVRLAVQTENKKMTAVWAEVFDLDPGSTRIEDEIAPLLTALRDEIELVRSLLVSLGVPERLTEPAFNDFYGVATISHMRNNWETFRGNMQQQLHARIFEWASWTLHEFDEAALSSTEREALFVELASLEATLNDSDLTPHLKAFVTRQIDTIRRALRLFGVRGMTPVYEALEKVTGAYKTQERVLKATAETGTEAEKTLLSKTSGVIGGLAKQADHFSKIKKAATEVQEIGGTVLTVVGPFIAKLLS